MPKHMVIPLVLIITIGNLFTASPSEAQPKEEYIKYMGYAWFHEPLTVVITRPQGNEISDDYMQAAYTGISNWSTLLREYTKNYTAWNINVIKDPQLTDLEKTPPDIVVIVTHDMQKTVCTTHAQWGGLTVPVGPYLPVLKWETQRPVIIHVYAACGYWYPFDWVRSAASHEFGHALGLAHAWNTKDLMCSIEYNQFFQPIHTCPTSGDVDNITLLDLAAVVNLYGSDGFTGQNVVNIPYRYLKSQLDSLMYVSTDKLTYAPNEAVKISGKVPSVIGKDYQVHFSFIGSSGYGGYGVMGDMIPRSDGSFTAELVPLNVFPGTYTVEAEYLGVTAKTSFQAIEVGSPNTAPTETYQESTKLTVSTQRHSYTVGDEVIINGHVSNGVPGDKVELSVRDPSGQGYGRLEATLDGEKNYRYEFFLDDVIFQNRPTAAFGTWGVAVTYSSATASTTFQVVEPSKTKTHVDTFVLTVEDKGTVKNFKLDYAVTNAKIVCCATVDKQFSSVTIPVSVQAEEGSEGSLEITLPRELLDAKQDGRDVPFKILIDGAVFVYTEVNSTQSIRTLNIPLPQGIKEIEIIGTQMLSQGQAQAPTAHIQVIAKQIKDVIILRVRNMQDSTIAVSKISLTLPDSNIKAYRGPNMWQKESGIQNQAVFSTSQNPIEPSGKAVFLLKVDTGQPLIMWEAYSGSGGVLAKGSTKPLLFG